MIPAINEILFYLTTLFALNTVFVSEQTKVTIDIENKTVQIEYIDLMTPRMAVDHAETGLKEIEKATDFSKHFPHLKLTSKKIYKQNKKLNATLNFSYDSQEELFKLIHFDTDSGGNPLYQILMIEKMTSTNGQFIKGDEFDIVQWDKNEKIIELALQHGDFGDKDFDDRVILLPYWKK